MENPGGEGSNVKPSEMENPRGWGVKLEKNPPWGGGGWIFSGTTQFTKRIGESLLSCT